MISSFKYILLAFLLCSAFTNAYAFEVSQGSDDDTNSYMNYMGFEPIKEKQGALPWKLFDDVNEIKVNEVDENGFDDIYTKPLYTDEIKKYDGQKVKLYGYMFPLTEGEKQSSILIGAFPLSCPYHYHVSPKMVVEVNFKNAVEFSFDPVMIEGTFKISFNKETQIFYYINDAKLVKH